MPATATTWKKDLVQADQLEYLSLWLNNYFKGDQSIAVPSRIFL